MARKQVHEDHVNHEAWAIPYGDLITLLLAFFVVMYAVSSVNEGKYRVMAEALSEAFGGPPRSLQPIQVGKIQKDSEPSPIESLTTRQKTIMPAMGGGMRALNPVDSPAPPARPGEKKSGEQLTGKAAAQLKVIREEMNAALVELISQELVVVRRTALTLEVEIKADILYASGSALLTSQARPIIERVAAILAPHENPIRVEGHTDNVPISTLTFPSNWELSAARATSVVRLFSEQGVTPERLSIQGHGEYKPVADNASEAGRNKNRRVVIVIMPSVSADELANELANLNSAPAPAQNNSQSEPLPGEVLQP